MLLLLARLALAEPWLVLPAGENEADWASALALAGATSGVGVVRVREEGDTWVLSVDGPGGHHAARVPRPGSSRGREDVALLAASLLGPGPAVALPAATSVEPPSGGLHLPPIPTRLPTVASATMRAPAPTPARIPAPQPARVPAGSPQPVPKPPADDPASGHRPPVAEKVATKGVPAPGAAPRDTPGDGTTPADDGPVAGAAAAAPAPSEGAMPEPTGAERPVDGVAVGEATVGERPADGVAVGEATVGERPADAAAGASVAGVTSGTGAASAGDAEPPVARPPTAGAGASGARDEAVVPAGVSRPARPSPRGRLTATAGVFAAVREGLDPAPGAVLGGHLDAGVFATWVQLGGAFAGAGADARLDTVRLAAFVGARVPGRAGVYAGVAPAVQALVFRQADVPVQVGFVPALTAQVGAGLPLAEWLRAEVLVEGGLDLRRVELARDGETLATLGSAWGSIGLVFRIGE